MINEVQIRNFKSIKNLDIPCKRINVFMGKPNVGKSNILEALSLYCAGYYSSGGFLKPFIRLEQVQDLFHRKNIQNPITIKTDISNLALFFTGVDTFALLIDPQKKLDEENLKSVFSITVPEEIRRFIFQQYEQKGPVVLPLKSTPFFASFKNSLENDSINLSAPPFAFSYLIKKYSFNTFQVKHNPLFLGPFLSPPYGENIVTILNRNRDLLEFFAQIFKSEYDLDLVIRPQENILEVQIKEGLIAEGLSIDLIADTLQRLMFYLTAIKSNKDSVLLLEEPETHSFPTYTNLLADNIARSKDNQFFITTHSPYLLRTLLEETQKEDLSIFITTYKDHQTHLHNLTDAEVSELLEYNIDLFYNYEKFVE